MLQVTDSIEDDDEDNNDNKAILDNNDDDSEDGPPVISNKHIEALYSQDSRPSEDIRKEIEEKKALEQEIAARNQFQVCPSLSFSLLLLCCDDDEHANLCLSSLLPALSIHILLTFHLPSSFSFLPYLTIPLL